MRALKTRIYPQIQLAGLFFGFCAFQLAGTPANWKPASTLPVGFQRVCQFAGASFSTPRSASSSVRRGCATPRGRALASWPATWPASWTKKGSKLKLKNAGQTGKRTLVTPVAAVTENLSETKDRDFWMERRKPHGAERRIDL